MSEVYFEIFPRAPNLTAGNWAAFFAQIIKNLPPSSKITTTVKIKDNELRFFLSSPKSLPPNLPNCDFLLLKPIEENPETAHAQFPTSLFLNQTVTNLPELLEAFATKSDCLTQITIKTYKLTRSTTISSAFLKTNKKSYLAPVFFPQTILAIDFARNRHLLHKKSPKHLNIQKSLHLLTNESANAVLKVDAYPYFSGNFFLDQSRFDFHKHSIVFGGSGTGKSKFLSLFVENLANNPVYNQKYKVIIIDPHDSLKSDLGGLKNTQIYDFQTQNTSLNLFLNNKDDITAATDLLLDLFRALLADNFNSKLERVLRFSVYLLIKNGDFSFKTLKKLLSDAEYRTATVKNLENILPDAINDFFLTDFNELKNKSYGEAIAPILSFVDELALLPAFYRDAPQTTLKSSIENNFLNIISLNFSKLGKKASQTIAGLITQQIFLLISQRSFDEHLILIVDEVAVLENPILQRFLSEARKYNLSLILAGQYFDQISNPLKKSIFANAANFFTFRVSREDSALLSDHLSMKTDANKIDILSTLKDRELVARVSSGGVLTTAFKARTLDFIPKPPKIVTLRPAEIENVESTIKAAFDFDASTTTSIHEIMLAQSTGRKKIENGR